MSDWNTRANEIFLAAMEIAKPEQRQAYVDQSCAGDTQLRSQVQSLLLAVEKGKNFLKGSDTDADLTASPTEFNAASMNPTSEHPGTVVGRYKLLQKIGEGGMGVVYMAEQERPVRRRVALKIIKPGMDSAQVIARFEAERQALAMMDHPNIARVLDAGATDSGRPYFVMELVQGIPITKYCDDKQLSTMERLALFIEVCHAIQHAHQKGIIHRDIKPSNVLIMIYDGKPLAKIIDFGVAKALHQQLTERTMFTQFGAVVGTLEYMSPEQAEMDALGTDTRSDIYSLGVLLYELLTGSTPMDGKKLRALGYAEMLKTIREVEPSKPSTRLTQSREEMETISSRRHTEPRRLQKMVAGDLDWIVMRCLEKDRTRRYETANGLAMDIQRHLNDEAVIACPPGNFYKLQKMVRRNKLVFTAVGCVTVALVLGLLSSLWQANRAKHEAQRANAEAQRASAALDELRGAAPAIATEARALAAQEQFDQAIIKLNYAAQLRPDVPDYVLAKADLLESELRFTDAGAAYRAALKIKPDHARAKTNIELCDQLAAAPAGPDGKLSRESLSKLYLAMQQEQRPAAEMMPLSRLLGDEKKLIVKYWLDRLKDLPNGTDTPLQQRLTVREDGLLELDMTGTRITDLSPLAGMPLGTLNLSNCLKVTDLSPLRGMLLTELSITGTGVTSLEPLRGMNSLQKLTIHSTHISDLSPLARLRLNWLDFSYCPVTSLAPLLGMPLEHLSLGSTGITDLSPLAGMPLKMLNVSDDPITDFSAIRGLPLETCVLQGVRVGDLTFLKGVPLKVLGLNNTSDLRNMSVLSEIPTLEVLTLPDTLSALSVEDFAAVEKLRGHPALKQLGTTFPITIDFANIPSKDEFWKKWDRDFAWALRLREAGISFTRKRQADTTWEIHFDQQSFHDLSFLKDAPISNLYVGSTPLTDLSALRSPTLSSTLKSLTLGNLPTTDFSPVSACRNLISFDVPTTEFQDLRLLQSLKLKKLRLYSTKVTDISPLAGMPLENLVLQYTAVTDLRPLLQCPTLKSLVLPTKPDDVSLLHQLPALAFLGREELANYKVQSAESFWNLYDEPDWAKTLRSAGVKIKSVSKLANGTTSLNLSGAAITDLSVLKGYSISTLDLSKTGVTDLSPLINLPLEQLDLRQAAVTDLSPLRSAPLCGSLKVLLLWKSKVTDFSPVAACTNLQTFDAADTTLDTLDVVRGRKLRSLRIARTKVTDLSVLAEMPLEEVNLTGTPITDLGPLLQCQTLKSLVLPANVRDITALRKLPALTALSYESVLGGAPKQTAAEFWQQYDAKRK